MRFRKPFAKRGFDPEYPITPENLAGLRQAQIPAVGPQYAIQGAFEVHPSLLPPKTDVLSDQGWAELLEVAWMAAFADVPFSQIENHPAYPVAQLELARLLEWYPTETQGRLFDHGVLDNRRRYVSPIMENGSNWGSWTMQHTSGIEDDHGHLGSGYSGATLAETVHSDRPNQFCLEALGWAFDLVKKGEAEFQPWVPRYGTAMFVDWALPMAEYLTAAVTMAALREAFRHKWHCDQAMEIEPTARPEEQFWHYIEGNLDAPDWFKDSAVWDMPFFQREFTRAEDFTAFPEGSPDHPSNMAGHATLAGACEVPRAFVKLQPNHLDDLRRFQWNGAHGRSWARVHARNDNVRGLELGPRIAQIVIPREIERLGMENCGMAARGVQEALYDPFFTWV